MRRYLALSLAIGAAITMIAVVLGPRLAERSRGLIDYSVPTVDHLATRLEAAGLGCEHRKPEGMLTNLTTEIETCRVGANELTIYVFRSEAARVQWEERTDVFGVMVTGDRWMAKLRSLKNSDQILHALDGRIAR